MCFQQMQTIYMCCHGRKQNTQHESNHTTRKTNETNNLACFCLTLSAFFVKPLSVVWEPLRHPLRHPRSFVGKPLRHPPRAPGTLRNVRVPTIASKKNQKPDVFSERPNLPELCGTFGGSERVPERVPKYPERVPERVPKKPREGTPKYPPNPKRFLKYTERCLLSLCVLLCALRVLF